MTCQGRDVKVAVTVFMFNIKTQHRNLKSKIAATSLRKSSFLPSTEKIDWNDWFNNTAPRLEPLLVAGQVQPKNSKIHNLLEKTKS